MKRGWHWGVVVASWLACLAVSAATLILASMFRDGSSADDRTAGLIITGVALAWLAVPTLGTWLLRRGRVGAGLGLLTAGLVLSGAAVVLVLGGIEAAARP